MGKATEILDELSQLPPREPNEHKTGRPALRLKTEQTVEIDENVELSRAVASLGEGATRHILVKDPHTGLESVLVPVDRYVHLVATDLESTRLYDAKQGGFEPSGLKESDIELVDPSSAWQK